MLCGVLASIGAGAFATARAQTAHFAGVETTIAQGGISIPGQIAVDAVGDVFIADTGNNRIVKESLANGGYEQSIVDANGLNGPLGITVDSSGNLYVADTGNSRIIEEMPSVAGYTSVVTSISGLNSPTSIAVDSSGNLYISDAGNSRILKETLVGSNYAQSALLTGVQGGEIAVNSGGDTLYVAIPGSGAVMMISTATGGSGTTIASGLSKSIGVAVNLAGVVYIADAGNGRILRVYLTGNHNVQSTTLETALDSPSYLAIDGNDTLYFADSGGAALHTLALSGYNFGSVPVGTASAKVSLLFSFDTGGSIAAPSVVLQGISGMDFSDAGTGSCTANGSKQAYTAGDTCTVDVTFKPLRAGWRNGAAELINNSGLTIATGYLRGWGDGPELTYQPGTVRTYTLPGQTTANRVIADGAGNLYINHAVAALSSSNAVYKETWTGSGYVQSLVATNLAYPLNIALDGAGNVYVLDEGAYDIYKFSPNADGSYTKSTFDVEQPNASALAVDGMGNVYFANSANTSIGSIQLDTPQGGYYGNRQFTVASYPSAIVVDGNQDIYFDTSGSQYLDELTHTTANYTGPTSLSNTNVSSLTIDGMGNIYTILGSTELQKLTLSGGSYHESTLSTVNAQQTGLGGVTVDGYGNLYWLGTTAGTVQKLDFTNPPALHFDAAQPGTTSADSPETLTIANAGSEPLQFPVPVTGSDPTLPEGFVIHAGGNPDCPTLDASSSTAGIITAGSTCQYEVSYSPLNSSDSSGWMTITDDNLNQTSPAYATQSIGLTVTGSPLTPTISWSAPSSISYGTPLSTTQLNASASVPGSFSYSPVAGSVLAVGTYTLSVTFTPDDTTAFSAVTDSVSITVNQATPIISWATPAAITYGTALSSTQLNASTPVAGTFTYSPATGTVLSAGSQTLAVTFTPSDTTDYTTASAQVTLTVNQATPKITWPTPAAITYGTALSATQLDATASVPGTFSYSSPTGTILTAGYQSITATFTPTDTTDYKTATATIYLTVNRATPTITWATPAAITYGTALSPTQLDATASVPGTFNYSAGVGSILTAGSHSITASFYPTDSTDYAYTTATVTLIVNQATPTITWTTPAAITYGTALSSTQLNARAMGSGVYSSSPLSGGYVYSPAAGAVLGVGSQSLSVTFTPYDTTDYTTATATVTLTVNQATPSITWVAPAAIIYGTALGAAQLNASSTVAGTFTYSPAVGTVLTAGSQTLTATFTPTDVTDYKTATATVLLTVNQATPTITWAAPAAIIYGTALGTTQLNATSTVPGSFTYLPTTGTVLTAGSQTLTTTFVPNDTTNYKTAMATVTLIVNPVAPTITWPAPAAISYGTALGAAQLDASTAVAGTFVYSPAAGAVLITGSHTLTATFTPTDQTDYTGAVASVTLVVSQATPTISWSSPAAITYGVALGAAQLNATSTVPGSFVYTPAAGTLLTAGTQTLTTTFTPTDATDYKTATANVMLAVNPATPTDTLTTSTTLAFVSMPVTFTAALEYAFGTPTGTVTFYDGTTPLGNATLSGGAATFTTSSLAAGSHSITAAYSGDSNFMAVTSGAVTETIETLSIGNGAGGNTSATASPGGQAVFTLPFSPSNGSTFPAAIQLSVSGLPTGATATFSPNPIPAGAGATNVTLTVTLPARAAVAPLGSPFEKGSLPIALSLILLPFAGRLRRAARKYGIADSALLAITAAAALTAGLAIGLSGCGGSSTPPPQTYTLTVTATSGSYSQNAMLTLIVE